MSWFAAIKAGVVLQVFGFLLRGERIEVNVHVVSSLGGGAAPIVLLAAMMLVAAVCFASYFEKPFEGVTLLGYFSFLLPFIPVLLLHLSHACVSPRPLGLASSLLGSLYFYFLGVDSL